MFMFFFISVLSIQTLCIQKTISHTNNFYESKQNTCFLSELIFKPGIICLVKVSLPLDQPYL